MVHNQLSSIVWRKKNNAKSREIIRRERAINFFLLIFLRRRTSNSKLVIDDAIEIRVSTSFHSLASSITFF